MDELLRIPSEFKKSGIIYTTAGEAFICAALAAK